MAPAAAQATGARRALARLARGLARSRATRPTSRCRTWMTTWAEPGSRSCWVRPRTGTTRLASWCGPWPHVDSAVHAQVQGAGEPGAAGGVKGVLERAPPLVARAPAGALDVVGGVAVVERPGDGLARLDLEDRRVEPVAAQLDDGDAGHRGAVGGVGQQ